MRRLQVLGLFCCVPCLAAVLLTGCGGVPSGAGGGDDLTVAGKSKGKGGGADKDKGGAAGGGGASREPIKATGDGVLKGVVKLKQGTAPNYDSLTKALDEQIKTDRDYCKMGDATQQAWKVGDNGGLGNVFVWIEPPAGKYFEVSDEQLKTTPKEVRIRQPHCAFVPHCAVLFTKYMADPRTAKPTGQKLLVENDAKVTHNSKVGGTTVNPGGNQTLGTGGTMALDLNPDKEKVTVECSIHPYMKAYLRVFNHPYAALSAVGKDAKDPAFGAYEIKGVPAGAKVRLFVWHEEGGMVVNGDEITLEKETKKDFEVAGK